MLAPMNGSLPRALRFSRPALRKGEREGQIRPNRFQQGKGGEGVSRR